MLDEFEPEFYGHAAWFGRFCSGRFRFGRFLCTRVHPFGWSRAPFLTALCTLSLLNGCNPCTHFRQSVRVGPAAAPAENAFQFAKFD